MHETIRVGEMTITFLKTRQETHNTLEMYELTMPPTGRETVPHAHRDEDMVVLGMNGVATWTVDGEVRQLRPGERLVIPRGITHSMKNLHDGIARMICMHTPGAMGPEFFREITQHIYEGELDMVAISEIMNRYGITPT